MAPRPPNLRLITPDNLAATYRFLADENVPGASIRLLPCLGYDVATISEIAPGTDNLDVIAIAQHALPPPGIVHFRETRQTPQDAALDLLALVIDPHVTLLGQYTVVRRERHIGQRPLPDR